LINGHDHAVLVTTVLYKKIALGSFLTVSSNCDYGMHELSFKYLNRCLLQLFDGHNGNGAAIYTKENLLSNILTAIPADLNREDWLAALPRAMVAAFVKTDKDFQTKGA
jgi:hypothetical protein